MPFTHFSKNGQLLPFSEATIPLSSVEYAYGFGVYENIRVLHGKILFLADHVERLFFSASVIELQHPFTPSVVTDWIHALVTSAGDGVYNLKVLLIGGRTPNDCLLFILPLAPLFPEKRLYTKGAEVLTYRYERQFPQAKTLNMLGSYVAYKKAREAGCYDALLINHKGEITEGTRTNFFGIRGMTLFSPPKKDILEGVTLKHVLEVARSEGYDIQEGPITPSELSRFNGAFLTSTSSKIMPLRKIDQLQLPTIPDALKQLMRAFDAFVLPIFPAS